MIIGIGGYERTGKTLFAVFLASNPDLINELGPQEYHIEQGFGDLSLFKTPYKWEHLLKKDLKRKIRTAAEQRINNTLFIIDEADQVWNPRGYSDPEQTKDLEGLGQHAKLGDVYIYTYQKGAPGDTLLGIDKLMRSLTRVDIIVKAYNKAADKIFFSLENRHYPDPVVMDLCLPNVSQYYDLYDHLQPVI